MKENVESILIKLITRYPQLALVKAGIASAFELFRCSFQNGGKLLLCGNGGSAADCEHIVGELLKEFIFKRPI
jgi:D-sedoheptulose 7-phosphate isomerase